MKIVTVMLGTNRKWQRLLRAFLRSVQENCPDADCAVLRDDSLPTPRPHVPYHCVTNTRKLEMWAGYVATHPKEHIVLIDADTVVLHDLSAAFDEDFDVAYTVRPGRYRMNGGVVFVRSNVGGLAFMNRWARRNRAILDHQPTCMLGVYRYGGINQASFAKTIADSIADPDACGLMCELQCETWNSVQETWQTFGPATRVLHVKSELRWLALGLESMRPEWEYLRPALAAWERYDGNAGVIANDSEQTADSRGGRSAAGVGAGAGVGRGYLGALDVRRRKRLIRR